MKKEMLNRFLPFWHTVRAAPIMIPFAGVIMMLMNPSVMAGGFTIGAILSSLLNKLLKMLHKSLYNNLKGKNVKNYLGQGMRPKGAKGTSTFLDYPLKPGKTWGMPSGHSQVAWYVVGFLVGYMFIWRTYAFTTAHKITALVIMLLMAILVSFSRVWVDGVHTLTQVIVGGIVGFVFGLITVLVTRYVAQKYWHEDFSETQEELNNTTTQNNVETFENTKEDKIQKVRKNADDEIKMAQKLRMEAEQTAAKAASTATATSS